MADDIKTAFQAAIGAGKINGAVICASDAEGNFVYDKALGKRTLLSSEKLPQQLDDVLFLASATKLLTTIAALQCVEDGLLTLTGDLSFIAPDLASKQVITGFSDDGETPVLEPPRGPITLEMLLTHSSGVVYDFINPLVTKWNQKFAPLAEGQRRPVEEAFFFPLAFHPGEGWMYGGSLDWAGRIIERITDDPEALGKVVLSGGGDPNKRSQGHFGGHGMFMAGEDYVKILRSILANDGKVLKPATVDDMFEHHLSHEATEGHKAALASPMGVFYSVGTEPGTKFGHGLGGLLTLEDVDGWYGERTLTWGGGLTLTWFIDRKNGLCGVGAVQGTLPLDGEPAADLKQTFRHDIYRKHAAWKAQQQASL
ncbi:hypothetical protein VE02_06198 [Pseudogymnoascus sp. 03VT05]|nr:hypothetical protein VE02_06198 [Pseudogymnoascus sp. 03VT05]